MKQRLPLIISATALAVAVLGSTPVGGAAKSAIAQVVPRAQKADFAANAGKLNGHRSSVDPGPGQIPVVGPDGKLAASLGAGGPAGRKGARGARGKPGVSGYQVVLENIAVPEGDTTPDFGISCPGGRSVLGGGYSFGKDDINELFVFESRPSSESTWQIKVSNDTGGSKPMTLYAVCANVAS